MPGTPEPTISNRNQATSRRPGVRPTDGQQIRILLVGYVLPALLWAGLAAKLIVVSHHLECCGPFPVERWTVTATFAVVLWLALPTLWLRAPNRFLAAVVLNVLATLLVVADLVHARFYGDPTSVSELIHAWQLPSVFASILASLHASDAWFLADIPAVAALAFLSRHLIYTSQRGAAPRWLRSAVALLALGLTAPAISLLVRDPEGVFEFAIGRRQVVAAIGIVGYHVYDAATHVRYRTLGRWTITKTDVQWAAEGLRRHADGVRRGVPPWGAARGKNLIIIQAESLQAFPIDLEIDGRPLMPNLRALARESLSADKFFDQTAEGSTSDAAFSVLQSLHPLDAGAVATRYPTNQYYGLPSILRERGYDTLALTGTSGEFWNMRQFLEALGFQKTCLDCPALQGLRFGQGLADGDFFRGAIPMIRALREPFFVFLMTLSNHHPYELPEVLGPLPVGRLANTLIGRYLQTVHYFDQSLGMFLRALHESGLLDRSVLVVYGDHQGYLGSPPELQQLLGLPPGLPIRQWEVTRRLPLLVRLPDAQGAGVHKRPAGHLNVARTVLTLLGIETQDIVMQGKSLFDDQPSLVVFRDGGFVADGSYLLTRPDPAVDSDDRRAAAGCYDAASGRQIECGQFEAARRAAVEELKLSDLILQGDMIPILRDRSRIRRENALSPARAK